MTMTTFSTESFGCPKRYDSDSDYRYYRLEYSTLVSSTLKVDVYPRPPHRLLLQYHYPFSVDGVSVMWGDGVLLVVAR